MTCDRRRLSFYRDGQLSVAERYEVDCHLTQCAQCTDDLRSLMRLAQTIRSLPMEPVRPRLGQDVRRLIAERQIVPRQPLSWQYLGRTVAPVAVAASIAVSLLATFQPEGLNLTHPLPPTAPAGLAVTSSGPDRSGLSSSANPEGSQATATQAPSQSVASARPVGAQAVAGAASSRLPVNSSTTRPTGNAVASLSTNPASSTASVPMPIARFYNAHRQVRDLLGEASPGSRTVTLLEQSFQGGLAIWRSDTREIYVLRRDGNTWSTHADTWRPDDIGPLDMSPPPGAMVPSGGFGSVWRSTPEIQKRLGWAVYAPRGSGGLIQSFEHGLIVWTPHGLLYVLTDDGRWHTYPDATPI